MTMNLEPGVYLDLPESVYFSVDALGSSDIKKLLSNPADWWYSSPHNPHRPPEEPKPHRAIGRALHCLMLEGVDAFNERFTIQPDPEDHPDAAKTVEQLKDLLDLHAVDFGKGLKKADFVQLAKDNGLGKFVWDCICEPHDEAVKAGKESIKASQYRAVSHMAEIAENHPDIGPALRGGVSEVSVFYRLKEEGPLIRNRLDSLQPAFTLDLKSMSNWKGKNVVHSAVRQITEMEYDLQWVLYHNGRNRLREFVKAGKVFTWDAEANDGKGGPVSVEPSPLLRQIADVEKFAWVWLFFQVRDDASGKAPIMVPRSIWPNTEPVDLVGLDASKFLPVSGVVFDMATADILKALENWETFKDKFGLDTPWYHAEPLAELDDGALSSLQYKRNL